MSGGRESGENAEVGRPLSSEVPLLEVNQLEIRYGAAKRHDRPPAVAGISFRIMAGETYGLVGESGSGKSSVAKAIVRLVRPTAGSIQFDGKDVHGLGRADLTAFRQDVQMVFQDPYSSLSPRMSASEIVGEPLKIHRTHGRRERRKRALDLLDTVGIRRSDGDKVPSEFSGGQRQRIGIARALAVEPRLLVCDEPTSALDVSVQAQIIELLMGLREAAGIATLFISHNLAIVKDFCDVVGVMRHGEMVETQTSERLFSSPADPYTRALIGSVLEFDLDRDAWRRSHGVA